MSDADPLIGTTVADGRYQIQRLLGAGGMGAVYLARQISMDRLVALKLIGGQPGEAGRDTAKRFHQEMRVTAKIEHPNTIRVYDYGETAGRLYLAMEYLEGKSLRAVILADRPLPVGRSIQIATQMAKALVAAHQEGIVHRDLKPENIILLDRYGERDFVKMLDFGIARSLDPGAERLTVTGGIIGTPAYMAPEQAGGQMVDGRTDLYALGTILYEMLTGNTPFQKPTAMSQLVAQMTEPPPPILERVPTLAPSLAALIDRLLAKQPDERPASAQEVLEQLQGELDREAGPDARGTGTAASRSPSRATMSMVGPKVASVGTAPTAMLPSASAPARPATEVLSPPASGTAPTPPMPTMHKGGAPGHGADVPAPAVGSSVPRGPTGAVDRPIASGAHPAWRWMLPALALVLVGIVVVLVVRRREPGASVAVAADASAPSPTALAVTRARLDRRLQATGEPPPPIACQSKDVQLLGKLAAALDVLQPEAGGKSDAKQAIALLAGTDQGSAERWSMLARAQLADNDSAQAAASAARALGLCPSYAAASNVAGKALQQMGKLSEAEQAFRHALDSDAGYTAPQFNLALLALKRGDAPGAVTMLTTLAARASDVPHLWLVRGQARLLSKDLPGAEADLRQAVAKEPRDPDAWRLLGEVLGRSGKQAEARTALCRAKGLGATLPSLVCQ